MKSFMKLAIYLIGMVFFTVSNDTLAASKSDQAKEKRWEEQIVPSLLVGEAVKLKAGGSEFLGLYTENDSNKALGGAILIHGMGAHPAWPDVIEPLRMHLPEAGWHTLSVQMPILENKAEIQDYPPLFKEVPARIQASVDYLKSKGINTIVIIGHSLGNTMTTYYLANKQDPAVRGFVAIAFGPGYPKEPKMDSYANFASLAIPTLDIYGSADFERNLRGVKKRAQAAKKAGNQNFQQIKIEGANHFFTNMDDILLKRIRGWLQINVAGNNLKQ
ncbi:MAG: DUF3530 family protein [Thioalkalispiraceae bacterium]